MARKAGVSHQTVTRFLAGFEGIRPATRDRVVGALEELHYRPNLTARSLKSGRSMRIGAISHDLTQVGPSRIAQAASDAARREGMVLDLVSVDTRDPSAIQAGVDALVQHSLAGVLVLVSTDEMNAVLHAAEFRAPVFFASDSEATASDLEARSSGIPAVVDHLRRLGHTRFAHVGGPQNWPAARLRDRIFEDAVVGSAGQLVARAYGDWSAESGHRAVAESGDLGGATALFAANDQMALGSILALKRRGLRVPEDISVVGMDDIPEAAYMDPPLTTLHVDYASLGERSVRDLLAMSAGRSLEPRPLAVPRLVVRESTFPPADRGGGKANR
ncbi:LacI family DNA-binding transcriptional regulator [Rathayibacter sp. VKM Ac-2928]|uniref:LacI family DNA-binding transcriptional regulator n=1 Tax=Rathayibacter sp. VKM Ac-2928 TaxID=2929479 RepID=UPI001FB21C89|nr:substrate-binding domain-containing protein [Rathayibacter sp. VKM Ac-2928]